MTKQFFQAVRGVLLALVLFELLLVLGGKISLLGTWMSAYPVGIAAVLLLLCLYRTWVRKARGGRAEYLVTMAPGAYGYIGGIFEKEKLGNPTRVPGGWFTGVRTYRAADGSLLFTVRRPGEGRPLVRAAAAVLLTAALLGPLSALSYVDMANTAALGLLGHDAQPSVSDTAADTEPVAAQPETDFTDTPQESGTDADSDPVDTAAGWLTGAKDWVSDRFDGAKDWVSGGFATAKDWVSGLTGSSDDDSADYILPSHERLLDESDVEGMDAAQIQRAINEIYARHGCPLSSSADKDYFDAQDWYTPDPDMTLDEAQAEFSVIENRNVSFLAQCRDALRG